MYQVLLFKCRRHLCKESISDQFPNKRFKNKSCVVVFFSYWTKHESPAGDQFENLVASAQFLVALATSESQFRTLL